MVLPTCLIFVVVVSNFFNTYQSLLIILGTTRHFFFSDLEQILNSYKYNFLLANLMSP